jgi:hypothetical protein
MKDKASWAVVILGLVIWPGLGYYWAIGSSVKVHQAQEHRKLITIPTESSDATACPGRARRNRGVPVPR